MSLIQAWIDRFRSRTNPEQALPCAVSDDGSANAIAVGELSLLRADPTTGALIVTAASGASLGTVDQGAGDAASPWQVQGVDGGVAERLATQTTLAAILTHASPGSSGPTAVSPKTVPTGAAESVAASTAATRYVRVTSDFANKKTVYVGGSGVTTANGQPLGPGDVYTNTDVNNANLIYCISADAAQVLRIEVL